MKDGMMMQNAIGFHTIYFIHCIFIMFISKLDEIYEIWIFIVVHNSVTGAHQNLFKWCRPQWFVARRHYKTLIHAPHALISIPLSTIIIIIMRVLWPKVDSSIRIFNRFPLFNRNNNYAHTKMDILIILHAQF